MKTGELIGLVAIVAILLMFSMGMINNGKLQTGINYLKTGDSSLDYRALARQKAQDHNLDPALFERQINQESGWNPNAVSSAGAIGIAQIMPSTAAGWHVDPWDPVASLSAAADHMSWYVNHYGSYEKGLACYNAGCASLQSAMARCGSAWKSCLPGETQRYIVAIMGV